MKASSILSLFATLVPLCRGDAEAPAPTGTDVPTATLPLGNGDAQIGWQAYAHGWSIDDIPPSLIEKFDLKARSVQLDARGGVGVVINGFFCEGNSE